MTNFQRKNAKSNAHVGIAFEILTAKLFAKSLPTLVPNFVLDIGHVQKKSHRFDLGCAEPRVIVECKSHTWTEGDKVPSAKLTTWDQTMLYFFLAPISFRKIFVVKKSLRASSGNSLLGYYLAKHPHVIPSGVEFWELDELAEKLIQVDFEHRAMN